MRILAAGDFSDARIQLDSANLNKLQFRWCRQCDEWVRQSLRNVAGKTTASRIDGTIL
jgi:hypothetical protein